MTHYDKLLIQRPIHIEENNNMFKGYTYTAVSRLTKI